MSFGETNTQLFNFTTSSTPGSSILNATTAPQTGLQTKVQVEPLSFANFRFKNIGQQPQLLQRFTAPDPAAQPYQSPSPPSSPHMISHQPETSETTIPLPANTMNGNPAGVITTTKQRMRPSLLEVLSSSTPAIQAYLDTTSTAASSTTMPLRESNTDLHVQSTVGEAQDIAHTITVPQLQSSNAMLSSNMDVDSSLSSAAPVPLTFPGAHAPGSPALRPLPFVSRRSPSQPQPQLASPISPPHRSGDTATYPTPSLTILTSISAQLSAALTIGSRATALEAAATALCAEVRGVEDTLRQADAVVNWVGEVVRAWESEQRVMKKKRERAIREEQEKKATEEQERKVIEEQERKLRDAEEQALKAKEERKKMAKEAEERRIREEQERCIREEQERKLKEAQERLAKEEEERRLQEELEQYRAKEAQERRRLEEQAQQRIKEEQERDRVRKEEEASRKRRDDAEQFLRREEEARQRAAEQREEFERRRKQVQDDKKRRFMENAERIREERKNLGISRASPQPPVTDDARDTVMRPSRSPSSTSSADIPLAVTFPPQKTKNQNIFVPATTEAGRRVTTDMPFSSLQLASEKQVRNQNQVQLKLRIDTHTPPPLTQPSLQSPQALPKYPLFASGAIADVDNVSAAVALVIPAANLRHLRGQHGAEDSSVRVKPEPSTPQLPNTYGSVSIAGEERRSPLSGGVALPSTGTPIGAFATKASQPKLTQNTDKDLDEQDDAVADSIDSEPQTDASMSATAMMTAGASQSTNVLDNHPLIAYSVDGDRHSRGRASITPPVGPPGQDPVDNIQPQRPTIVTSRSGRRSSNSSTPVMQDAVGDGGWHACRLGASEFVRNPPSALLEELDDDSGKASEAPSKFRNPQQQLAVSHRGRSGGRDHYSPPPDGSRVARQSYDHYSPPRRTSAGHASPDTAMAPLPTHSTSRRPPAFSPPPSPPARRNLKRPRETEPWEDTHLSRQRRWSQHEQEMRAHTRNASPGYVRSPSFERQRMDTQLPLPSYVTGNPLTSPRDHDVKSNRRDTYRPPPVDEPSLPTYREREQHANRYHPDYDGQHGRFAAPHVSTRDQVESARTYEPEQHRPQYENARLDYDSQHVTKQADNPSSSLLARMSDYLPPPSASPAVTMPNTHSRRMSDRSQNQSRGSTRGGQPYRGRGHGRGAPRKDLASRLSNSAPSLQERLNG